MASMYPEVIDATTVGARFAQTLYMPIGIEGEAGAAGTATVGTVYDVDTPSEADTLFGTGSLLANLIKFVLDRGVPTVRAVASDKGTTPILTERQTAWALLEADPNIRIRLTDTGVQADIVALADSCENAELINNKQVAFVGMAAATAKAALLTAATAIASKRAVLVAPAIYDDSGTLRSGMYAAAWVACEVAKNADIADDLDTLLLAGSTGIEEDASGLPIFRKYVSGGTATNDFDDLLDGGVSPLRQGRNGGAEITHLRTTYTTDTTFDALQTRLIADQLYVDIRNYAEGMLYLRKGNTPANRADLGAGVEALLKERANWIQPKLLPDGTTGYGVVVTASADNRSVTVGYQGVIVRGIQKIYVDAKLEIPV